MKKGIHSIRIRTTLSITLTIFLCALSGAKAANTNVLTNPGFEDSNGWTDRSCTFTYSTAQKHSGSKSGLASGRTATWQGIQQSILDKVITGSNYSISAWLRLDNKSSDTVKISIQRTVNGTTSYYTVASGTATNTDWTRLAGSYTVDDNLTALYVYFEGPASDVNFYVDDANVFGPPVVPPDPNAKGDIDTSTRHQVLEGFGASGAWYENWLLAHPLKTTLYNILFGQSGLDIYRIRNTYQISSDYIDRTAQIVREVNSTLGHPIEKIMISSWSPPAYLKSDGNTVGGTLAKDFNDPNNGSSGYVYQRFAQWWFDSLADFNNHGILAEYINIQNEPDWLADWDTCKFNPTESSNYAGYNLAFQAFCAKMAALSNPPKLLAPETAGFNQLDSYIDALFDRSAVYGYAHHLYNGGGDGDNPDGYIPTMTSFAAQYGYKPLLQTEYSHNESNFTDAINLAKLMHNSLTVEKVVVYIHWSLFWGSPGGLVSFPSYGSSGYTINPVYYAFKHYAAFTDPNWQRIEASTNSSALRISAYISPDNNQMSVVIINTSADTDIALDFNSFGNFEIEDGNVYRTTSTQNCVLVGAFNESVPLALPKNSITTVALTGTLIPENCQEVQNLGYRLLADLNSDCYVNFEDLLIMTTHWLETAPIMVTPPEHSPDIHTGTDNIVNMLDFTDFAAQWLTCNVPLEVGCISNWQDE